MLAAPNRFSASAPSTELFFAAFKRSGKYRNHSVIAQGPPKNTVDETAISKVHKSRKCTGAEKIHKNVEFAAMSKLLLLCH